MLRVPLILMASTAVFVSSFRIAWLCVSAEAALISMSRWWLLLSLLGANLAWAKPESGAELRSFLNRSDRDYGAKNMVHHRFTIAEISQATGLSGPEIEVTMRSVDSIFRRDKSVLEVWPYPGGRHPRIGFLGGAIRPQRDTKVSVFTPWDPASCVVVLEALRSNLGLAYLAHTHMQTLWSDYGVALPKFEWEQLSDGSLMVSRTLPNRITFGAWVIPQNDHVAMVMWLHNGTNKTLTDLRVQNCVMLKGAECFDVLTNDNKTIEKPFVACESAKGGQCVITAWELCDRSWANVPVTCLHSDPKFPDAKRDEWQILNGWLSFYEDEDVNAEFSRIKQALVKKSLKQAQASLES